jgi:hypothetical protein
MEFMNNRVLVLACTMVALTACMAELQQADAQDDPRPPDRPKVERDGGPKDFRFPFDGPPPKEGLRKPMPPFQPGQPGFDDPWGGRPPHGGEGAKPPRGGEMPGPPDGPHGGPRGPLSPAMPGTPGFDGPPPPLEPPRGPVFPTMPGLPQWLPVVSGHDPQEHQMNQEEYELARKTTELTMRYRHAPAEQREQVKKELTDSVNRHFEVRQQRRELQLKRLEEELQRLRESIQARNEAREQIVNRRIAELLGDKDDLSF